MFIGFAVTELEGRDLLILIDLKTSFFSPSTFGGCFFYRGGLGMCAGEGEKYPNMPHFGGFEHLKEDSWFTILKLWGRFGF